MFRYQKPRAVFIPAHSSLTSREENRLMWLFAGSHNAFHTSLQIEAPVPTNRLLSCIRPSHSHSCSSVRIGRREHGGNGGCLTARSQQVYICCLRASICAGIAATNVDKDGASCMREIIQRCAIWRKKKKQNKKSRSWGKWGDGAPPGNSIGVIRCLQLQGKMCLHSGWMWQLSAVSVLTLRWCGWGVRFIYCEYQGQNLFHLSYSRSAPVINETFFQYQKRPRLPASDTNSLIYSVKTSLHMFWSSLSWSQHEFCKAPCDSFFFFLVNFCKDLASLLHAIQKVHKARGSLILFTRIKWAL